MVNRINVLRVSQTPSNNSSTLFASSSFGSNMNANVTARALNVKTTGHNTKSDKYSAETSGTECQSSTRIIRVSLHGYRYRHRSLKRQSHKKTVKRKRRSLYLEPTEFKPYPTNRSSEHGQVSFDRQRKKEKKKNIRPIFSRLCSCLCAFCCLLAIILIGTLIAALVLHFTSSYTTTLAFTTITTTSVTTTTTTTSTTTTISTTTSVTSTTTTTSFTTTSKTTTSSTTSITTTTSTSTTSGSTICSTTAITTAITSAPLPPQCSNYTLNTDGTRNAGYGNGSSCDIPLFTSSPTWVRFSGAAGTLMANCPVQAPYCSTNAPGWYSGIYPSTAGDTTNGTVCYARPAPATTCTYSNSILVTNCNGYYVYALVAPPVCNLRYCTI